jgi:hypothetical protein
VSDSEANTFNSSGGAPVMILRSYYRLALFVARFGAGVRAPALFARADRSSGVMVSRLRLTPILLLFRPISRMISRKRARVFASPLRRIAVDYDALGGSTSQEVISQNSVSGSRPFLVRKAVIVSCYPQSPQSALNSSVSGERNPGAIGQDGDRSGRKSGFPNWSAT